MDRAWLIDDGESVHVYHHRWSFGALRRYQEEYGLADWEITEYDVTAQRCAAMDGVPATPYFALALGVVGSVEACCPGCEATIVASNHGNCRILSALDHEGDRPLVDGGGELWCSRTCWEERHE